MKMIIGALCGILLTGPIAYGQKNKIKNSAWEGPQDKDQPTVPWNFVDKETKLAYAISNDASNLYLRFKASDEFIKMKIIRAGMTVSIDTTGKKKRTVKINYPMQSVFERPTGNSGSGNTKPDSDAMKAKFQQQPQNMMLSGFRDGNGIGPLRNGNGVVAELSWDPNDDLIYELVVPFSSFWTADPETISSTRVIALQVTLDAMERPSFNRTGRSGGMGRPGGGRPGGGGRPSWVGAGGGQDSGEFAKLFSEQKLYTKFTVAPKP